MNFTFFFEENYPYLLDKDRRMHQDALQKITMLLDSRFISNYIIMILKKDKNPTLNLLL
jgi:hypothetical protein